MRNTDTLKSELEAALSRLGMCLHETANKNAVLQAVRERYVEGSPRAWWLALKHRTATLDCDDGAGYHAAQARIELFERRGRALAAPSAISSDEPCITPLTTDSPQSPSHSAFLIADDGDASLYVYVIETRHLAALIEDCRYFEYYVVAHDMSWLICENDHSEVIVCEDRQPIPFTPLA